MAQMLGPWAAAKASAGLLGSAFRMKLMSPWRYCVDVLGAVPADQAEP